jgi:hypothetical protein
MLGLPKKKSRLLSQQHLTPMLGLLKKKRNLLNQ